MNLLINDRLLQYIMRQHLLNLMVCFIIFSASLSGCIGDDEESKEQSEIDLIVYYDITSGTIQENIQSGSQVSFSGVELSFNYAFTKSNAGEITTYYFESGDGSTRTEVDANETGEITYNYVTHGLFTATLGALDDAGNDQSMTLTIRIDKNTQWSQSQTTNPDTMNIDTTPDCDCNSPSQISIDSNVENPANGLGGLGGEPVTVTWKLTSTNVTKESTPEQLGDGQDATWLHNEIGPSPETWKLDVELNHNNEQVNIEHTVSITYSDDESSPNPMPTTQAPE